MGDRAYAYVLDVGEMCYAHYRSGVDIYPASVVKVAIMAEAFRRYAAGTLRPHDSFTITPNNLTETAGPTPFVAGYSAASREMVELMIARSDNIATNQLIDILRRESVTSYMRELRLHAFLLGRKLSGSEPLVEDPEMVGRNRMPPVEIAQLLLLIATDSIAGAREQREILGACEDGEKLVAGLAPADRFMHKTGETSDVDHDAGILETAAGKRYVIVLYTTLQPGMRIIAANAMMSAWMRRLRQAL